MHEPDEDRTVFTVSPMVRRPPRRETIDPRVLRSYRETQGLSQAELARQLGVHYSTVSRWEAGNRPVPAHIALALLTLAANPSEPG